MPTPREREYYRMGFQDGYHQRTPDTTMLPTEFSIDQEVRAYGSVEGHRSNQWHS